jgi:hypothetical protein
VVQIGKTRVEGKTVIGLEWTVYLANKKASWFTFEQLTGSGLEDDAGYQKNNAANPSGANPNLPFNRLRSNQALGLSDNPGTIADEKRRELILDPGPRTVAGVNAAPREFEIVPKGLRPFEIATLGRVLTDKDSNLIVLGGNGSSGTTDTPINVSTSYANNPGWFDDVSDGSVTATLLLDDGSRKPVDVSSWVLCGPPRFAPQIVNLVTLFDTLYDIFTRNFGLVPELFSNGQFQPDYRPSFVSDIRPILIRPNLYRYVAAISAFGRSQHSTIPTDTPQLFAQAVLTVIRDPIDTNAGSGSMPKIAGDNPLSNFTTSKFLTVTPTQYFILSQYAKGLFSHTPSPPLGDGVTIDRAHLENCVGGAFCPGIEITWICRNQTIYTPLPANPSPSDAFRFRHKDVSGGLTLTNGADNDYSAGLEPGDLIKYMAQPWQSDFNECSVQPIDGVNFWWWPAQRPYSVYPAQNPAQQLPWTRVGATNPDENAVFENLQMVANWKDLGFILDVGTAADPKLVEIERNQQAISGFTPPAPPQRKP